MGIRIIQVGDGSHSSKSRGLGWAHRAATYRRGGAVDVVMPFDLPLEVDAMLPLNDEKPPHSEE